MKIQCRYTFQLPRGNALLIQCPTGSSPKDISCRTNREDVEVVVRIPGETTALAINVGTDEAYELWELREFEVHVNTPFELESADRERLNEMESEIVTLASPLATEAASAFVRTARWRSGHYWLPDELTSGELTSVDYYLGEERILGTLHVSTKFALGIATAMSQAKLEQIEDDLTHDRRPTLPESLLLDARAYGEQRDWRVALALAAIALEVALVGYLRRQLTANGVGTESQIDRFLEHMSNRLLSTVVLGMLDIGDTDFRERCREVFEMRNALLHGKKHTVGHKEANAAVLAAHAMIGLLLEGTGTVPILKGP